MLTVRCDMKVSEVYLITEYTRIVGLTAVNNYKKGK